MKFFGSAAHFNSPSSEHKVDCPSGGYRNRRECYSKNLVIKAYLPASTSTTKREPTSLRQVVQSCCAPALWYLGGLSLLDWMKGSSTLQMGEILYPECPQEELPLSLPAIGGLEYFLHLV